MRISRTIEDAALRSSQAPLICCANIFIQALCDAHFQSPPPAARLHFLRASLGSALAAGLTSASGSAMAASEMQELAATLHAAEFSPRVDQLLKAGHPAQALELADLGLEKKSPQRPSFASAEPSHWNGSAARRSRKALRSALAEYPEFRSHTTTWR